MRKLVTILVVLISSAMYSQTGETSRENVLDLLNQINSLSFKKMEQGDFLALVGRVKEIEIYWIKTIEEESVTYQQIILNTRLGIFAEGHRVITDLHGGNASGTHEKRLNYKKI